MIALYLRIYAVKLGFSCWCCCCCWFFFFIQVKCLSFAFVCDAMSMCCCQRRYLLAPTITLMPNSHIQPCVRWCCSFSLFFFLRVCCFLLLLLCLFSVIIIQLFIRLSHFSCAVWFGLIILYGWPIHDAMEFLQKGTETDWQLTTTHSEAKQHNNRNELNRTWLNAKYSRGFLFQQNHCLADIIVAVFQVRIFIQCHQDGTIRDSSLIHEF